MLECLQQQPAARPTSLQVLKRLRALAEADSKPPSPAPINVPPPSAASEHAAKAPDTPDAVNSIAAGTLPPPAPAATAATPPAVAAPPLPPRIMSIQLRPTPPSPFAS